MFQHLFVPRLCIPAAVLLACLSASVLANEASSVVPVGVAQVDITPTGPVRLAGYASRETETETIAQRLWAKAIAIGDRPETMAVLVMVESCGVPDEITTPVAEAIHEKLGVPPERIVIAATHIHSGPWLDGYLPHHSASPIPPDHRAHLTAYSKRLQQQLVTLIETAVANRKPARIDWAEGKLTFAANRRVIRDGQWAGFGVTPDGPVDHSMPILRVTDTDGKLRAVIVNYACHCTTLTGKHDCVHGDWAGCAQESIQKAHPGTTAMVVIGCGGDANPEPRATIEAAEQHGGAVAKEVDRLLAGKFQPLSLPIEARATTVQLPFGDLPSREQLATDAKGTGSKAFVAQHFLASLERGESLPTSLDYSITTWRFGDALTMVFLPGEVVAGYSLRLKRELGDTPLWITAYANDVPCYIPTKRIIAEGGYEVDRSMQSYGQPTRFAPEIEETVIGAVHTLVSP